MRRTRTDGFTLVELLVVVAIIALLLAILLPALNKSRDAARNAVCGSNNRSIGVGMVMYVMDSAGRFPYVYHNTPPEGQSALRWERPLCDGGYLPTFLGKSKWKTGIWLCPLSSAVLLPCEDSFDTGYSPAWTSYAINKWLITYRTWDGLDWSQGQGDVTDSGWYASLQKIPPIAMDRAKGAETVMITDCGGYCPSTLSGLWRRWNYTSYPQAMATDVAPSGWGSSSTALCPWPMYDSSAGDAVGLDHPAALHAGGTNVSFTDGHVECLSAWNGDAMKSRYTFPGCVALNMRPWSN